MPKSKQYKGLNDSNNSRVTIVSTFLFNKKIINFFFTSERSERSSCYQSYIGRLDDIQRALKPLK